MAKTGYVKLNVCVMLLQKCLCMLTAYFRLRLIIFQTCI